MDTTKGYKGINQTELDGKELPPPTELAGSTIYPVELAQPEAELPAMEELEMNFSRPCSQEGPYEMAA